MLDSKLAKHGPMMSGVVVRLAEPERSGPTHGTRVVVFQESGKPAVQVGTGDGEYETMKPVARTRGTARIGIAIRITAARRVRDPKTALAKGLPSLC